MFYDKLNFTYIELRHFNKTAAELKTDLDRWLYTLKHLSTMEQLPAYLRKPIFTKLFQIAEYNNMTKQERLRYDRNQMHRWDNKNVMDYAIKETREKTAAEKDREREIALAEKDRERESALAEKDRANARIMKQRGYPIIEISVITGLSTEEIEKL